MKPNEYLPLNDLIEGGRSEPTSAPARRPAAAPQAEAEGVIGDQIHSSVAWVEAWLAEVKLVKSRNKSRKK